MKYYDTVDKKELNGLPNHVNRDGFTIALKNANGEIRNLKRCGIIPITPAKSKKNNVITKSHGEYKSGKYKEIVDEQVTIAAFEQQKTAKNNLEYSLTEQGQIDDLKKRIKILEATK